jgi:hypothetical protein
VALLNIVGLGLLAVMLALSARRAGHLSRGRGALRGLFDPCRSDGREKQQGVLPIVDRRHPLRALRRVSPRPQRVQRVALAATQLLFQLLTCCET